MYRVSAVFTRKYGYTEYYSTAVTGRLPYKDLLPSQPIFFSIAAPRFVDMLLLESNSQLPNFRKTFSQQSCSKIYSFAPLNRKFIAINILAARTANQYHFSGQYHFSIHQYYRFPNFSGMHV